MRNVECYSNVGGKWTKKYSFYIDILYVFSQGDIFNNNNIKYEVLSDDEVIVATRETN